MGKFCTTTSLDALMYGVKFDSLTSALADKCIEWSENEIKKVLTERYDFSTAVFLTSTSIPPVVRSLCEQLSEGHMWIQMSRGSKQSITRGEAIKKGVIDNMMALNNNDANLFTTAGGIVPDRSDRVKARSNTEDYYTTFDEDSPLKWQQDPTKISDIESERS